MIHTDPDNSIEETDVETEETDDGFLAGMTTALQRDAIDAAVAEVEAAGLTAVVDTYEPRYDGDVVAYVQSVETVPGTYGHPQMERTIR